ncbi:MAG: penicillin-binding protein [Anaerolineales bacterium]|nr:penicillin-binding protein [Anaerolineales bacterium]
MSDPLTILRQRRERRLAANRSAEQRTQRISIGCGFVFSLLAVLLILSSVLGYAGLTAALPAVDKLPALLTPPNGALLQPTRVYDRTGEHLILSLAPTNATRRYIPLDPQNPQHLPQSLVDATIALADPDFRKHPGYTLSGVKNPDQHPTLAQNLVYELLLYTEPATTRRAWRERLLASQVTARYGRSQVLEWYLNSANYGKYAFGSEAASQLYFGKSVTEVNLSEAAILAATAQSPSLNPHDAPQAARQRGQELIKQMLKQNLITENEAQQALAKTISFSDVPAAAENLAPSFTNLVFTQLENRFKRTRLERGGLVIQTTLDLDLQLQADCAVRTHLLHLSGSTAEIEASDGSGCESARYLSALPPGVSLPGASTSVMVIDPQTGQVLAVVGQRTPGGSDQFLAEHPAGTLINPFIYLTGFTRGLSPASLLWDIPLNDASPLDNYRGPVRLRLALVNDYPSPAVQVLEQMGMENVWNTAQSFGLNFAPALSPLDADLPVSLLDVAGAYGVFASQGSMHGQQLNKDVFQPVTVLKVTDVDHAVWLDWTEPQSRSILTPQLAYLMTDVLSDESARWESLGKPNPLEIGRPAAAKLGTARYSPDIWTVGYTPQRLAVVWMESGQTADSSQTLSPRLGAILWQALMQYLVRDLPPGGWEMPPGITRLDVCDPSGLLPTTDCPNIVSEIFLSGSEPQQADTLYRSFEVNRETGYLATVFTPPQMVEERIFMVVPPDMREWAAEVGIESPPEAYDAIQVQPYNPEVRIDFPAMFDKLGGIVAITGTAAIEDFSYYRLEYGQGLTPRRWIQIGDDGYSPVEDGLLAEWDTSGLNGLYALRLVVVRSDQRIETAIIAVTVVSE